MIQQEIDGMRRELGQARELVRDAIDRLTAGFARVGELIEQGNPPPESLTTLRKELSGIVMALQFQDMLDQLLNHAVKRVDEIERALTADGLPAAAGSKPTAAKPVAQSRMSAGDIELF